jgi:hypothetical protein
MTTKEDIIEELEFLSEDEDLPQSVLEKVTTVLQGLRNTDELSMAVNKAMNELEDVTDDVNIPTFVKTQLWGVMSKLSALEAEITDN